MRPTEAGLTAGDRLAIEELYARYNHAIHEGDATAWTACFSDDGTFSNVRGRYSGRAALAGYVAGWIGDGGVRYWLSNVLVEAGEDAGTAEGTCYLAIIGTATPGQPARIQLTGRYTDTLRKDGGRWTFASRHIARD